MGKQLKDLTLSYRHSQETKDMLEEIARIETRSVSNVIDIAIKEYYNKLKKEQ